MAMGAPPRGVFPFLFSSLAAAGAPVAQVQGAVVLKPSMRTFGNALKAFPVKGGHEQLLFNFSSEPAPSPTVIVHVESSDHAPESSAPTPAEKLNGASTIGIGTTSPTSNGPPTPRQLRSTRG